LITHTNTLSSIANQSAALPLAMRFYILFIVYNIKKTCYAFVLQVIISKNYSKDENNNGVNYIIS